MAKDQQGPKPGGQMKDEPGCTPENTRMHHRLAEGYEPKGYGGGPKTKP